RGDGTFGSEKRFPGNPTGGEFIVTSDFNGDGKLDFISAGQFGSGISLVLGNGDGTFQAPIVFAQGRAPATAVVGDFNRDGKLDLACTEIFSLDHEVLVFLGHGDGRFQDPVPIPVGLQPWGLAVADFNRDGKLDLATANSASDSVSILLGNGNG